MCLQDCCGTRLQDFRIFGSKLKYFIWKREITAPLGCIKDSFKATQAFVVSVLFDRRGEGSGKIWRKVTRGRVLTTFERRRSRKRRREQQVFYSHRRAMRIISGRRSSLQRRFVYLWRGRKSGNQSAHSEKTSSFIGFRGGDGGWWWWDDRHCVVFNQSPPRTELKRNTDGAIP